MKKHQQQHYALRLLLCLIFLCLVNVSFANEMSIGRYLAVEIKPQNEQQHLLEQHIQIKFPQNILTIKQAVQFILQFSGYRLADDRAMNKSALAMLSQPLPEVDRSFGPMTLAQSLTTLSGDTFYLLADPVHRLIAYKIKMHYQRLYVEHNSAKNECQQIHGTIK